MRHLAQGKLLADGNDLSIPFPACQSFTNTWELSLLFYSNEHEPIHVHGKSQGRETKAELIVQDGQVVDIIYSTVRDGGLWKGRSSRIFRHW